MNMQFQPNDPPGKLSCDKLEVIQYRMGLVLWGSKLFSITQNTIDSLTLNLG